MIVFLLFFRLGEPMGAYSTLENAMAVAEDWDFGGSGGDDAWVERTWVHVTESEWELRSQESTPKMMVIERTTLDEGVPDA